MMLPVPDMTGERFGRLTVLERAPSRRYPTRTLAMWVCKCDCGKTTVVPGAALRSKNSKSCGCGRGEPLKLPNGVSSSRAVYGSLIRNATKRGLPVDISLDDFLRLTQMDCTYCGSPPSSRYRPSRHANGYYVYNGLDRMDNAQGYLIGNVTPCCDLCNDMKGTKTLAQFLEQCRRVAERYPA